MLKNKKDMKNRKNTRMSRREEMSCETLMNSTQYHRNKGNSTMGDTYDQY